MSCTYCGSTGYSSIGSFCRCPIGAALRIKSNLETIIPWPHAEPGVAFDPAGISARLHTDGADDRKWFESVPKSLPGPIATGVFPDDDLTPETMAERLAKTPPPIDRIPTPDHFICSTIGCSNRVTADNRKCWDCQAEEDASEYDPADDRLAILLYGIVLGVGLALVAVWLGWVRL